MPSASVVACAPLGCNASSTPGGSAGVQRRGPGDHVALVGDGVETDVGGLHPALDDRLVAVGKISSSSDGGVSTMTMAWP